VNLAPAPSHVAALHVSARSKHLAGAGKQGRATRAILVASRLASADAIRLLPHSSSRRRLCRRGR
jgi:hypothetical protein